MATTKKVVLLGHFGVGKTSLVRRFVDSSFSEEYLATIGVHIKKKTLDINGQHIALIIWDIEGHVTLSKVRESYLAGMHAALYVFDVSRPDTYADILNEVAYLVDLKPGIPIKTIGNKIDLVNPANLEAFKAKREFFESTLTSAKTGENVEEVFQELAGLLL